MIRQGGSREQGQALPFFAMMLVIAIGAVALSVDVGNLVHERRKTQNAADSAALAAVAVIREGGTRSAAMAEGASFAAANGYSAEVTINNPPLTGPATGNPNAFEVIIHHTVPKYFLGVVYKGDWSTTSRAVARITTESKGFGVVTLNPTRCNSLHMNSNALLQVTGGGIYVNSNCNTALVMESNATATANAISVVGGFDGKANYHATPEPATHQPAVPDPFASIPVPVVTGLTRSVPCEYTHGTVYFDPGIYNCKLVFNANTVAIFRPGNYSFAGGMQLDSNVTLNFGRGIYVMKGGGFQMNSNAVVNGPDGVLIYNTCAASCGASGTFQLNSNARLNIKPYGAPYANISVFQDRASNTPLQFNSNATTLSGAIYSKTADIQYNSNAEVPLQFVANTVQMNSNARIVVDVAGMSTIETTAVALTE
ncbi:MAG: hypothetical protein HY875_11775 [Chloroflexi bacterium]|nr:hypothetical protein [Chloroflexota bacterium]